MKLSPKWKRRLRIFVIAAAVLGGLGAWFAYVEFFREEPEQEFADEAERFKYGSIGAEAARGMPYYVWLVLPRVFPEYVPGPGGYKAFGLVWEEGRETPSGFVKRTIGFPRIANNCAICHTGTWRAGPDEVPHVVVGAPSHTTDVQGMIRFLYECADDPRFEADTLLAAIDRETKLSFVERQVYRFVLIPLTRSRLAEQKKQFAWMDRPHWPQWGKGRDDPMNLTKYFMTSMPVDETVGQADFPSVWNLGVRKGGGRFLNWSCDTPAVRSVLIDSALGLGAAPDPSNPIDGLQWSLSRRGWFVNRMAALDDFLSALPPPKYPFPIDAGLAKTGEPIYARYCASCHEPGAPKTNTLIPMSEIRTDRERLDTWTQAAADEANRRVKEMGIDRPDMVKQEGYQSPPLDGLWMRAPYLHNGSVPNLREMLEPAARRSASFVRGYDVYDTVNVGFVCTGAAAERAGFRFDVKVRGDGNVGHDGPAYGTDLSDADKKALVEFLKTK